MKEKAMGAVIRSRAKYQFHADRPSKYFLSLEKSNFNKKTMYRLQLSDGSITMDPKVILETQKDYYSSLYTSKGAIDGNYVSDIQPCITDQQKEFLNAEITLDDISKAVRSLPNNKLCGPDSFTLFCIS